MTAHSTNKYESPPINEIGCDILFDSIEGFRAGHFGLLWQKFRPDFSVTEDQNLVTPVPKEDVENPDRPPLPRVWFVHTNDNEVVQIQRNRFVHNWRKRQPYDEYPGYEKVIENFETYLARFEEFLAAENLGNLKPNQYVLTYINVIPQKQGWETLRDLEKVFPNFLSLTKQNILSTDVRGINWQTNLGIPNDLGHLQISISSAQRVFDNHPVLHIQLNAMSNHPYEPIRDWFDAAHNSINKNFVNLVSTEVQEEFWGPK